MLRAFTCRKTVVTNKGKIKELWSRDEEEHTKNERKKKEKEGAQTKKGERILGKRFLLFSHHIDLYIMSCDNL